ncbi:MAG: transposase [Pseudonocardiaceae bacterium]
MSSRTYSKAQRSRISEFTKAVRTIRKHRGGIDATIEHGLSNGRQKGLILWSSLPHSAAHI